MKKAINYTLIIVSLDLVIAVLMLIGLIGKSDTLSVLKDIIINLIFALFSLYYSAVLMAKRLFNSIHKEDKIPGIVGFGGLFIPLSVAIFAGAIPSIIDDMINTTDAFGEILFNTFFFPYFVIVAYGLIPTLLTSIVLGYLIASIKPKP